MREKRLAREIRELKDEGIEKLLHLSYDRLASGSRYPYRKRADLAQEEAIKNFLEITATAKTREPHHAGRRATELVGMADVTNLADRVSAQKNSKKLGR